jgi:hypothetical protein
LRTSVGLDARVTFLKASVQLTPGACPGWIAHTYGVFLPKHRRGNPGGYSEYLAQHADGSDSLID